MRTDELKKGLIVSCQATSEEPMRDSGIMGRFALAAQMGGAVGVRMNGTADIMAARQLVSIPVIGLIKRHYEGYWPYITPTLREVEAVYLTGAELVAIDATAQKSPSGMQAATYIQEIKKRFPDLLVVADISTIDEGMAAEQAGADLISTTLAGYTDYTKQDSPLIIEFQPPVLGLVYELVDKVHVPVIAEGRYWNEEMAEQAMKAGAHNVVIGAGITRPQIITKKITDALKRYC